MRLILVLLTAITLTACGFTPMYGSSTEDRHEVQAALNEISIDVIPDREGQYLRNRLIDRFHTKGTPGNPRYRLIISALDEKRTDLDITRTDVATRAQIRLSTRVRLMDISNGQVVMQRDLSSVSSYNILASQFTTRVSEDNARLNAIDDLARQTEQQVVLYLR